MEALKALHTRVSSPRLTGEVTETQLHNIFRAALRAPDHALLRPWRFLLIQDESIEKLGEVFVRAALKKDPDLTPTELARIRAKPFRAPLIITGIARVTEHPSVPEIEQLISCGAAMQNMMLAAHAQGVGAMWRTGVMAYDRMVQEDLGLEDNEQIIGYLYLGQIPGKSRVLRELDIDEFFQVWTGD